MIEKARSLLIILARGDELVVDQCTIQEYQEQGIVDLDRLTQRVVKAMNDKLKKKALQEPIGGHKLDPRAVESVVKLVSEVQTIHPLQNGSSALFWHLIATLNQHIEKSEPTNDDGS